MQTIVEVFPKQHLLCVRSSLRDTIPGRIKVQKTSNREISAKKNEQVQAEHLRPSSRSDATTGEGRKEILQRPRRPWSGCCPSRQSRRACAYVCYILWTVAKWQNKMSGRVNFSSDRRDTSKLRVITMRVPNWSLRMAFLVCRTGRATPTWQSSGIIWTTGSALQKRNKKVLDT